MSSRVPAATLAALVGLVIAAPTASATDYFATTDNTATTQNCQSPAAACALGRAMAQIPSIPGPAARVGVHTLTLAPGTYDNADVNAGAPFVDDRLFVDSGLTMQGTPGQPVPVIDTTGAGTLSDGVLMQGGGILRDLTIQGSSGRSILRGFGQPAEFGAPAQPLTLERVTIAASGSVVVAADISQVTVVRNSRITHSGGADAFALSLSTFDADVPRVVNSTITAPAGTAIGAGGGGQGESKTHRFELVNDVIRGAVDIEASSTVGGVGTPGPVILDLKNSAFRPGAPTTTTLGPVTINQVTAAITADPLLDANGVPGAGSPLIDAGAVDPDSGTADLLGKSRTAGSAVDIGAFEFQPAPPNGGGGTPPPPSMQCGCLPPTTGPGPDKTAPTATSLTPPKTLKRSKLTKGKGVSLTATVSESLASAKVELLQITKKKGKASKEKILGTATLGAGGPTLTFPLKVKASKLAKKGKQKLTLRFTFVDAAGNTTVVDKAVTVS